jgi:hypothetical protein
MRKNGQFYLMAAIIIIALIIGFAAIRTGVRTGTDSSSVMDLAEELGLEGARVVDTGIYYKQDGGQIVIGEDYYKSLEEMLRDFTAKYKEFVIDKELVVIYSTEEGNVIAAEVKSIETGCIATPLGGSGPAFCVEEIGFFPSILSPDEEGIVIFQFDSVPYEFELQEGENFFFILSQKIDGEQFVATG